MYIKNANRAGYTFRDILYTLMSKLECCIYEFREFSEREFAVCDIFFKDMMYYVFHLIFVGIIPRVRI